MAETTRPGAAATRGTAREIEVLYAGIGALSVLLTVTVISARIRAAQTRDHGRFAAGSPSRNAQRASAHGRAYAYTRARGV